MQQILLHNWKEKLVCLLLGAALWYLIHQNLVIAAARPPGGRTEAVIIRLPQGAQIQKSQQP